MIATRRWSWSGQVGSIRADGTVTDSIRLHHGARKPPANQDGTSHADAPSGNPAATSMKTIDRRILKLEDRVRPGNGRPLLLLVLCNAGWGLALDQDRCLQILGESEFLPTGHGLALVNLLDVPDGLNAEELEGYLRENGAETRGLQATVLHEDSDSETDS